MTDANDAFGIASRSLGAFGAMQANQLLIIFCDAARDNIPVIFGGHVFAALAHFRATRGIPQQGNCRAGDGLFIVRWNEETGLFIFEHAAITRDITRDNRHARRQCFKQNDPKTLRAS